MRLTTGAIKFSETINHQRLGPEEFNYEMETQQKETWWIALTTEIHEAMVVKEIGNIKELRGDTLMPRWDKLILSNTPGAAMKTLFCHWSEQHVVTLTENKVTLLSFNPNLKQLHRVRHVSAMPCVRLGSALAGSPNFVRPAMSRPVSTLRPALCPLWRRLQTLSAMCPPFPFISASPAIRQGRGIIKQIRSLHCATPQNLCCMLAGQFPSYNYFGSPNSAFARVYAGLYSKIKHFPPNSSLRVFPKQFTVEFSLMSAMCPPLSAFCPPGFVCPP